MATPLIVVLTPSGTTTGTGTTLADLRNDLADQVGEYQPSRVSAVPAGGDPTRYVLSDDLSDADASPYGGLLDTWLYVSDGDAAGSQQRLVTDEGALAPDGGVRLARALAAPLDVNTTVLLTAPLPVRRYRGVKGLDDCLDEALDRLAIEVRVALVGNGTRSYSLAAYPWLSGIELTRGLYDSLDAGTTVPAQLGPRLGAVTRDGAAVTLETTWTYTTADTFYVAAVVPASQLIYDGTAWQYQSWASRGLRGRDSYAAVPPSGWVLPVAMVKALAVVRRLIAADRRLSDAERSRLGAQTEQRMARWGQAARRVLLTMVPEQPGRDRDGMVGLRASAWSDR